MPAAAPRKRTVRVGGWVGGGSVWTTTYRGRAISRIDAASNHVTSTLRVAPGLQSIAFAAGKLWVADYDQGRLLHLGVTTGRVIRHWETGSGPRDLLLANRSVSGLRTLARRR